MEKNYEFVTSYFTARKIDTKRMSAEQQVDFDNMLRNQNSFLDFPIFIDIYNHPPSEEMKKSAESANLQLVSINSEAKSLPGEIALLKEQIAVAVANVDIIHLKKIEAYYEMPKAREKINVLEGTVVDLREQLESAQKQVAELTAELATARSMTVQPERTAIDDVQIGLDVHSNHWFVRNNGVKAVTVTILYTLRVVGSPATTTITRLGPSEISYLQADASEFQGWPTVVHAN